MAKFQKGQSGNPGGRPKMAESVRDLARAHTEDAIKTLVAMLKAKTDRARVAAAQALLDRGWGKAAQPQTGEHGEGPVRLIYEWNRPLESTADMRPGASSSPTTNGASGSASESPIADAARPSRILPN